MMISLSASLRRCNFIFRAVLGTCFMCVCASRLSESFQRMGLLYHQAHFKLPPSVSTASAFVKPFAIFVHSVVHVLAAL